MLEQVSSCGITLDPIFQRHQTPAGHPERSARLEAIEHALENWEPLGRFRRLSIRQADPDWLQAVHTGRMIERIQNTAGLSQVQIDGDTYTSEESYQVSLWAVGSVIDLARQTVEGKLRRGFAFLRPPGHHAESHQSMGFCLFNNVAVTAEHVLRTYDSIRKVAIVDFDVHHGNGTQEIFYTRPDVLYISSHQMPLYPGTGAWHERGLREGEGFTMNFPLRSGMGDEIVVPLYADLVARRLREFEPDLLLVSAGFDAHIRDPLAGLKVSSEGFGQIVSYLRGAADELSIPEVYALEGGYDLVGLAESVRESMKALLVEGQRDFESNDKYGAYRAEVESRFGK